MRCGQRSTALPAPGTPVREPSGPGADAARARRPRCAARAIHGLPPDASRPRRARETHARVGGLLQVLDLGLERGHRGLVLRKRLGKGLAVLSAAESHEVDDPGDTTSRLIQLGRLPLEHVRDVRAQSRDLLAHTIENPGHGLKLEKTIPKGARDHFLRDPARHTDTIAARMASCGGTAVVATPVAADQSDGTAATAADHRSGKEVRRVGMHPRPLARTETTGLASGPDLLDLAQTLRDPVPERLRHDAERLVVAYHPLRLRLVHVPAAPGPAIAAVAALVPDPVATVLGVLEGPTDGSDGPATRGTNTARDVIGVQPLRDAP